MQRNITSVCRTTALCLGLLAAVPALAQTPSTPTRQEMPDAVTGAVVINRHEGERSRSYDGHSSRGHEGRYDNRHQESGGKRHERGELHERRGSGEHDERSSRDSR